MIYRIRSYHGGLGDELQFSTFPRVLSQLGHQVSWLIDYSAHNQQVKPLRNQGILKFVWEQNPFIKGKSCGDWNIGDVPTIKYENKTGDFIQNWELAFGLEPINSLPEIYYNPVKFAGLDIVIELSGISLKYDPEKVKEAVDYIFISNGLSKKNAIQLEGPYQSNAIKIDDVETWPMRHPDAYDQLCELSNCIYNSKIFISLSSGSHSLAAAIRRKNPDFKHFCILPDKDYDWIMEKKLFVYPGIQYLKEAR